MPVILALEKQSQEDKEGVQGQPWPHCEFEVSMGYIRPCFNKAKQTQTHYIPVTKKKRKHSVHEICTMSTHFQIMVKRKLSEAT